MQRFHIKCSWCNTNKAYPEYLLQFNEDETCKCPKCRAKLYFVRKNTQTGYSWSEE